ncbi:MAG: RING/Ubox like zinc-binding domain-containing protein [Monoraphidium minutum]|nr:MAG: RING/Ubox like zinc-binding domain-containing protein [Monoraphidium minutum]
MDEDCPLCAEALDATDKAFNPCRCGYKVCLWCFNTLMESSPARCPNCRAEYVRENINAMAVVDTDGVMKEQLSCKKKAVKKGGVLPPCRVLPKNLQQVRVVQRNLVYAVGLPLRLCTEEALADKQYFGAYGRIKKISINRSTPFSQVQRNGPTGSAYVTYCRPEDALRCIEEVDGQSWDGKVIKACFGTTKYCNAFLKGVACNNADCLYLHEIGG